MITVSVSELKNQLSANLEKVRTGESILILDRRKPVAVIEPIGSRTGHGALEALIVSGTVQAPSAAPDAAGFLRLPKGQASGLQAALLEERDAR